MLWLALLAAMFGLAYFLWRRRLDGWPGPGHMRVICQDEHGRVVSREWVKVKEPDHFPENGLAQLDAYVDRVFASNSEFATLSVFGSEGERGASLWKVDGGFVIGLIFRVPRDQEREDKARSYFESLNCSTRDDYLGDEGRTRILHWWVGGDAGRLTHILRTVLRDVNDIGDAEGLNVTFEEVERKRPRAPYSVSE